MICQTSITEQGQGSESLTAQIVGSVLGVSMERVRVILGDTDNTPYGGGTWASRGAGIGGEAALQAGKILRKNILDVAAAILQSSPAELDIVNDAIVSAIDGSSRIDLKELSRIVVFPPRHLAARHSTRVDGNASFRASGISVCLHEWRSSLMA